MKFTEGSDSFTTIYITKINRNDLYINITGVYKFVYNKGVFDFFKYSFIGLFFNLQTDQKMITYCLLLQGAL